MVGIQGKIMVGIQGKAIVGILGNYWKSRYLIIVGIPGKY